MFQLKDEVDLSDEEIYERELRKALMAEEQWIIAGKQKGLQETIIGLEEYRWIIYSHGLPLERMEKQWEERKETKQEEK